MRPLGWHSDGFGTLPELDKVLAVLHAHIPWLYLSSSVTNCVSLSASSTPLSERAGAGPRREMLSQDIYSLAASALASKPADPAKSSCSGKARGELRERQHCMELLLSTAREQMEPDTARRLSQSHRQQTDRGEPKRCVHGQVACEVLVRYSLCNKASAGEKDKDVSSLYVAVHHMTMMAVQDAVPSDRLGGLPDRMRGAMRDLQRRAFHLQRLVREMLPLERERMLREGADGGRALLSHDCEFQELIREHMILVMHRILACAAALER
uniref:Uncharacterized protein n=1 Tax=Alexandrium andersonii TaxID=327968 RepID=A0A7S2MQ23_9DINO